MKPYASLTTLGKARRLRPLALAALENYDLDVRRVSLITNEQNGIFRVDTKDGGTYIMRVCLPDGGHDYGHFVSEMMWLEALRDTDVHAPIPLKTKSGDWVTRAEAPGVPQARYCVVFSWVTGVDLADRWEFPHWHSYGVLSARLHSIARGFAIPDGFETMSYNSVFPFREDCVLFDAPNRDYFDDEQRRSIRYAIDRVEDEITALHENREEIIVTHGDLHQWNVRIDRGLLSPIDFEDIMWAHPIQDLATTIYYVRGEPEYDEFFEAFKRGYETVAPFPEASPGQLETHMVARRLNLLNYVFAAEEENPDDYPDFLANSLAHLKEVRESVWKVSM